MDEPGRRGRERRRRRPAQTRAALLLVLVVATAGLCVGLAAVLGSTPDTAGAAGSTTLTGTLQYAAPGPTSAVTVTALDSATETVVATSPPIYYPGNWSLTLSHPGPVRLRFTGTGLATVWNGQRPAFKVTPDIALTGGTVPVGTTTIGRPATISGTVRHGDAPLGGQFVIAAPADTAIIVALTVTGADGRYTLPVPAGDYRVGFVDPNWLGNPATGLAPELYDDDPTVTFATSAIVSVVAGGEASAVDAGLSSVTACPLASGPGAALGGADLADCHLAGATLTGADLTAADAGNADLAGADLVGATLDGTGLHRTRLANTDLTGASLVGASAVGADLTNADLTNADLTDADLTGAAIDDAVVTGVTWTNTTCPDGTNANGHGGTCVGFVGRTFAVNATADRPDANPGDGECLDDHATCTLRAAVMEANASPGRDTVQLAPDAVYTLDRVTYVPGVGITGVNEDGAATGDLDLTEPVRILGARSLITGPVYEQTIDVLTSGRVEFDGIELSWSSSSEHTGTVPYVLNRGDLRITRSAIRSLQSQSASGIRNYGTLTLNSSTIGASVNPQIDMRGGTARVEDATIVASNGPAGSAGLDASLGTIEVSGTVLGGWGTMCTGSVTSADYNTASGDASGCSLTGAHDEIEPGLWFTYPQQAQHPWMFGPAPFSPLVDRGRPGCAGTDQLGRPRATDGDGDGTASCDRGAIEIEPRTDRTYYVTVTSSGSAGSGCTSPASTCTFTDALGEANATNGRHVIELPNDAVVSGVMIQYTIPVGSPITVHGHGSQLKVRNSAYRGFNVNRYEAASFEDLTITTDTGTSSADPIGGDGAITLDRTLVRGWTGRVRSTGEIRITDAELRGIGVTADGPLTITRSLVTGAGGGAVVANGPTTVIDASTLAENTAGTTTAGGLTVSAGTAELRNSTVSANTGSGSAPGGVEVGGGSLTVTNSIVADQKAGTNCAGTPTSGDYNLASDSTCGFGAVHDLANTSARLLPLSPTGGPHRTMLPLTGSQAIDRGQPSCGATDERGRPRPVDGDGNGTARCDRGAVEVGTPTNRTFTVTSTADLPDADPGDGTCQTTTPGTCTLRAAVMEANASNGQDTINLGNGQAYVLSFADAYGGGEAGPASGDLDLGSAAVVHGNNATVSATGNPFELHGGSAMAFDQLTMGALVSRGPQLVLSSVTVNATGPATVPAIDTAGPLVLNDSRITGTSAGVIARSTLASARTAYDSGTPWALTVYGNSTVDRSELGAGSNGSIDIHGGTVAVTSSTLASAGGSPAVQVGGGTVTVSDATVGSNAGGGGIARTAGTVTVTNSIVTANAAQAACTGTVLSGDYNVVSDTTCAFAQPHDLQDTRTFLWPLADNGGPTRTRLPDVLAAAIDSGRPGCPTTDQRGSTRPVDGNEDGTATCDRGAVELPVRTSLTMTVTSTATRPDTNPGDGDCATSVAGECTWVAAVAEANASNGPDVINLPANAGLVGSVTIATPLVVHGNNAGLDAALTFAGPGPFRFDTLRLVSGTHTIANPDGSLTFTGGGLGSYPAEYNFTNAGTLVLDGFTDNQFNAASLLPTSSVANAGSATVVRSRIGGVSSTGTLSLTESTVLTLTTSGTATVDRSQILSGATISGGTTDILRTTVGGGFHSTGLFFNGGTNVIADSTLTGSAPNLRRTAGSVTTVNTILAETWDGSPSCVGTITSGGWNLAADASCAFGGTADLNGVNPGLGPFDGYGSSTTQSRLPVTGSAALDSGRPGCLPIDQRGATRPADGDGDGTATCDRGSTEAPAWNPLTMTVNSTADVVDANPGDGICATVNAGECTVRAALMESNTSGGPDVVDLQPGASYALDTATIGAEDLGRADDLDIISGLTLHGHGASISGCNGGTSRVLDVPAPVTVTVEDLTLTHGCVQTGALLRNAGGAVTLRRTTLTADLSYPKQPAVNSALYNSGTLTLEDSTISANPTIGIDNVGALTVGRSTISGSTYAGISSSAGSVAIQTSTLSGNGATGLTVSGGSATITDSTVAANTGGGIKRTAGTVTITNSIVANQVSGNNCWGTMGSGGYNLASDTTCPFTLAGDARGVAVALGALAANGGPTLTHLPTAGSLAIGTGAPGCSGTDQRGVARPQGGACDKGAVEQ